MGKKGKLFKIQRKLENNKMKARGITIIAGMRMEHTGLNRTMYLTGEQAS